MESTRHHFLSYKSTSVKIKRVVCFMKIRNLYNFKDIIEIVKCQPEENKQRISKKKKTNKRIKSTSCQ